MYSSMYRQVNNELHWQNCLQTISVCSIYKAFLDLFCWW